MNYILQFLAYGKQPQWSGIFRTKEEAFNYVNDNVELLDERAYEVIVMFSQDKEYRIFYENAAFIEDGDDDEESKKEECGQEGFCSHCEEFKSN